MKATSIRARVRAEMTDEIKTIARRHLATDGAANLSLRAVARDLGVVSSAIYRYFPSRDDLLTALILDAYNALGAAVEAGDAAVDRADLRGRYLAVCHAVRNWGLAHEHEYALIYGSPVPGYAAPAETTAAATRSVTVLGRILQDGATSGALAEAARRAEAAEPVEDAVVEDLTRIAGLVAPDVPFALLSRGLGGWLQLFGTVSFELFGQFNNAIENRGPFFERQMNAQADYIGL